MIPLPLHRLFVALAGVVVLGACTDSRETVAGGSSTETSNTLAARFVDDSGRPVSGALVKIRPSDWGVSPSDSLLPDGTRTRLDTVLDTSGSLHAGRFRPGTYAVEVLSGTIALRRELRTGQPAILDTLVRVGGLAGRFSPSWPGLVRILGTDIEIPVDSTGSFQRAGIPAGGITLDLIADSAGVQRKARVRTVVPPRATADIGPVALLTLAEEAAADWSAGQRLILDNTQTGLTRDVDNVPLWIPLPDTLIARMQPDASDLRVRDENGVSRPYAYTPSSAFSPAGVWAALGRIDGSSNEHHLRILWGNDEAPVWSSQSAVFDSGLGWRAVWHFDGTLSSAVRGELAFAGAIHRIAGVMGEAQAFDGSRVLEADDPGSLEPSDLSVSVWAWIDGITGTEGRIVWKDSNGQSALPSWGFLLRKVNDTLKVGFRTRNGPSDSGVFSPVPIGRWVHLAATIDRTRGKAELFVDGVSKGAFPIDSVAPAPRTGKLSVGQNVVGRIDELRVSRLARPPAWFELERINVLQIDKLLHP